MLEKYTSPEETLTEIRHLMERSSRFISLSGFSGVFAGIYALAGALAAWLYTGRMDLSTDSDRTLVFLFADALIVLVLAISTGILLTTRQARREGNSLFDAAAKKLIINLCIPLVAGAGFCVAFIYHGNGEYVAPAMLTFYGLALVHASKYTRDVVRSLGIAEIVLGLACLWMTEFGLIFWAAGFGVMHIAYGIYMYLRYEK